MEYKINIHAHTYFSDGLSSPLSMALTAWKLGFTALVITDHYEELQRQNKYTYRKAIQEAKTVLPVIVGIEIPYAGNHILVFGGAAIKTILAEGPSIADPNAAYVLAHPNSPVPGLDAYEKYNAGMEFPSHPNLQAWCNSDAHKAADLEIAYNLVDTKIVVESDLIRFIKRQRPVKHYLRGEK